MRSGQDHPEQRHQPELAAERLSEEAGPRLLEDLITEITVGRHLRPAA
jgi:hypothetical protein